MPAGDARSARGGYESASASCDSAAAPGWFAARWVLSCPPESRPAAGPEPDRYALRMRPDRLIVGEVRGAEALDLLIALSTGHAGSLCTIHAGSAAEALRRLETLALMADVGLPLAAIRDQIADAIDIVVRQERGADGARRIVEVAEVVRVAGGPGVRELFTIRAGRPAWRAPLGDTLAGRLAAAGAGRTVDSPPVAGAAVLPGVAVAPVRPGAAHDFLPPDAAR